MAEWGLEPGSPNSQCNTLATTPHLDEDAVFFWKQTNKANAELLETKRWQHFYAAHIDPCHKIHTHLIAPRKLHHRTPLSPNGSGPLICSPGPFATHIDTIFITSHTPFSLYPPTHHTMPVISPIFNSLPHLSHPQQQMRWACRGDLNLEYPLQNLRVPSYASWEREGEGGAYII